MRGSFSSFKRAAITFIHPELCSGLSHTGLSTPLDLLMEAAELSTASPYGTYAVRAGERGKHVGIGHSRSFKARGPAEQMAGKRVHGRAPRLLSQRLTDKDSCLL